jgi:hypothetical protein
MTQKIARDTPPTGSKLPKLFKYYPKIARIAPPTGKTFLKKVNFTQK